MVVNSGGNFTCKINIFLIDIQMLVLLLDFGNIDYYATSINTIKVDR